MTGKEIIDQVRQDIGDASAAFDWNTLTDMIPALNFAVRKVAGDRPDALISAAGAFITIADITAATGTVSLETQWKPAIVEEMKRRLFSLRGDGKENRDRATMHQALYDRELS